jgi:hypothetical protein
MCTWFSDLFENALVNRVNRRYGHPHGEVLALDVAGTDILRNGVSPGSATPTSIHHHNPHDG